MEKPTLRKAGYKMVTIRIRHDLSLSDLVELCLGYLQVKGKSDLDNLEDELKLFTKKEFEEYIRTSLGEKGFFNAINQYVDEDIDKDIDFIYENREKIKAFLLEKYPEWK